MCLRGFELFMRSTVVVLFLVLLMVVSGCGSEPQTVEVTRIVNQEVALEVTRVVTEVVTEMSTVEVPVEVTRVVEVVVTATPEVVEATTEPTAVSTVDVEPTAAGNVYTIVSGDNLSIISTKTGVAIDAILTANDITTSTLLSVGQQLLIPGWSGEIAAIPTVQSPPPTQSAAPAPAPSEPVAQGPVGPNLLPNPSFEEDWYFSQGVSEWQIPNNWLLVVNEGANTLPSGDGGNFLRPEIRVVPKSDIPAKEHPLFVFDGQKTIKAFKGGAPTSFAIFTDVVLQPGAYRLTINFFPDIVSTYDGGTKIWAAQQFSSEVRIIVDNGGTQWSVPQAGVKGTLTYDFVVDQAGTVRVGGAFRSRYINNNNGWFLDAWSLQALGTP